MTESSSLQASPVKKSGPQVHATTLRAQLVWASLFPLATFVLLSALVATVAFRQLTLTLTLQRDTARVQAAAGELASSLPPTQNSIDSGLSASLKAGLSETGLRLFVVNQNGEITVHSGPGSGSARGKPGWISLHGEAQEGREVLQRPRGESQRCEV